MCARIKEPFEYTNRQDFKTKLSDWVGDVLYDTLPESGYEERDEQIYTAFQIADALCDHKVHLAEAGLGTGKTFAYLLPAIPYARFTGKPVVIACASSALQEQLASETGDISTLSKLLNLPIDARMAKDSRQYVCDVKAIENQDGFGEEMEDIKQWLRDTSLGERAEMPTIPDRIWKKIRWDESLACDVCDNRGYCKLIKAREYYRGATDFIIVDHETFFFDLWTREERIANGLLPLLPNYSAVVFDEGHKILLPASMQAGNQISKEEIDSLIVTLQEIQDARKSLVTGTLRMERAASQFFGMLNRSVIAAESSERLAIRVSDELLNIAAAFRKSLDNLLMEMQIEQELYIESLTPTQMQALEGQIERAVLALSRFCKKDGKDSVTWVSRRDKSFWVVPRNIGRMLDKHLYAKDIPVIFTSATLSSQGDFAYFKRSAGLKNASKSTVGSPFDLEDQVTVYLSENYEESKEQYVRNSKRLAEILLKNEGRALILAKSLREVRKIREALKEYEFPFTLLWEDQGDRGYLVQKFRKEETSVLVGSDLWEGIDVPGDALTLVVIWQLPFPALDPLLEVQKKEAREQGLDPVETVDYPEMGLKLKQGCGRLIRTKDDKGSIVILAPVIGSPWEKTVLGAVPDGAKRKKIKK